MTNDVHVGRFQVITFLTGRRHIDGSRGPLEFHVPSGLFTFPLPMYIVICTPREFFSYDYSTILQHIDVIEFS
jgi:hypothetical protein